MALYIKDKTVDDLAIRFQKATGSASKIAAVHKALQDGLAALKKQKPLLERMKALQEIASVVSSDVFLVWAVRPTYMSLQV